MGSANDHYSYRVYADPETARNFDRERFGGQIGEYIKHAQESAVFSVLPDVAGWNVLDIGAGTGRFTIPFLEKGAHVAACDASEHMLQILQSKAQGFPHLQTQIVDAHHLPFADQIFDCAVSFRILMHLIDWKKALTELCRVSKDWVLFDFPPKRGFLTFAPAFHIVKQRFTKHYQPYKVLSICQIREHLKSQGFEIQNADHGFFLPIAVHRMIGSLGFTRGSEKLFLPSDSPATLVHP